MRERLAIVAIALLAFGASLWSPFFFDDYAMATDPAVTRPDGVVELFSPERTRPLTYLTFWANYQLSGFDPLPFHLVNLLLFAGVVWLVGGLFERVAGPTAGLVALAIFALHPLQTETVAYVFARATLLTTLFCLLSWRSWLDGSRWQSVAWFAAALLAKEEAATFPLFLAGYEWFFRGRRQGWAELAKPLAAMLALVGVFAVRLYYATRVIEGSGAGLDLGPITPWTYLLTQARAIWLYLRLFVAPMGQSFDRDFPLSTTLDFETIVAGASLLIALKVALGVTVRWRWAWWFAGALILLAPTSSFAPLADLTAERRMFLPLLSLSLFGGSAVAQLGRSRALAIAAALALVLSVSSWRRTEVYASEIALWRDAAQKAPNKVRPKLQLARALEAEGPSAQPARQALLQEALALGQTPEVLGEIGVFYLQSANAVQAEGAFRQALALAPRDAQTLSNLGTALAYQGRAPEAEMSFRQALDADRCNFDARMNLILMLAQRGAADEVRLLAVVPEGCPFSQGQLRELAAAGR
ncbi:MAG: glycosyltransferase family 39 protein [Bryobacterales bacterium]|nr:glycosyltransferase family 39 protein [Bryobacterales bacterium]